MDIKSSQQPNIEPVHNRYELKQNIIKSFSVHIRPFYLPYSERLPALAKVIKCLSSSGSRSGRPWEWRWGLWGRGPDWICPETPVVESGVREQLRPDCWEVFRGHAAHDGRGDWMVRARRPVCSRANILPVDPFVFTKGAMCMTDLRATCVRKPSSQRIQVCWLPLSESWEDRCHSCRRRVPASTGKYHISVYPLTERD